MKKLLLLIAILVLPASASAFNVALVAGGGVAGDECSFQDTISIGQNTDLGSEINAHYWVAYEHTTSVVTDCAAKVVVLLTSGSDVDADAEYGWALYGDASNPGDYPDGSDILFSGYETGVSITGNGQTLEAEFTSVESVPSGTYWIATCINHTGNAKVEYANGAGRGIRFITTDNDCTTPPTDWSGSTSYGNAEISTYILY